MYQNKLNFYVLKPVCWLLITVWVALLSGNILANERDSEVVLATISNTPKDDFNELAAIGNYIVDNTPSGVFTSYSVLTAATVEEMQSLIRRGKVDLFIDSLMPLIKVGDKADIKPSLRSAKDAVMKYSSVIFVHADSNIFSLNDLKGKKIAFKEQFSTSGFLLPIKSISQNSNLKFQYLFDKILPTEPGKTGYVFSKDNETTLMWVLKNRIDAGASSDVAFNQHVKSQTDKFRIIHNTIEIPRQMLAFRGDFPVASIKAIQQCLLKMHTTDSGRLILNSHSRFKEFKLMSDKDMDILRKLGNIDIHVNTESAE